MTNKFIPWCDDNGEYYPRQCYYAPRCNYAPFLAPLLCPDLDLDKKDFCWCVLADGTVVPNTEDYTNEPGYTEQGCRIHRKNS